MQGFFFKFNSEPSEGPRILAKSTPAQQVSLQRENIPDEMDAEQTWPTEEEIAHAREGNLLKRVEFKIECSLSPILFL